MSGVDNLFNNMRDNPLVQEATEATRQARFEERIVKQLLRYAGVEIRVGVEKKQAEHMSGSNALDFAWLRANVPAFPAQMASSKLAFTSGSKIGWTALFGAGFAKLPWFREYKKVAAAEDWDIHADRCALVFNAPGADQSASMVLHNQPIQGMMVVDPERRQHAETRLIRPYGSPQVVYVIESLRSYMDTVGADWAVELCQPH